MRSPKSWATVLLVIVLAGMTWWQNRSTTPAPSAVPPTVTAPAAPTDAEPRTDAARATGTAPATPRVTNRSAARTSTVGFRTHELFVEHFRKHGREFGAISEDEYLRRAQALRDAPAGGDVIERERKDGVVTRFDRASGAFLAFEHDGVIRTFFRPNQGEAYFWRQLERPH